MKLWPTNLIILIIIAFLSNHSSQQSCSSRLFAETETKLDSSGICPLGFVNFGGKCFQYSTVLAAKNASSCDLFNTCILSSMTCTNQKCYQGFRYTGDYCELDSQCLQDATPSGNYYADYYGTQCINNKCSKYRVEKLNDGETCYNDHSAKTIYGCKEGSTCYKCCSTGQVSKCVPIVKLGKGELCENVEIYPSVTQFKLCANGLQCKETVTGNGKWTCMERIPRGGVCGRNNVDKCDNDLVCRQTSPTDSTQTCQSVPFYGDSCVNSTDCAFSNSELVYCFNNKCQRIYGSKLGENCKQDEECYSAYCSSEGKCAEKQEETCSSTSACSIGQCSCGGKASLPNSLGKCTNPCYGPATDVKSCLYNIGVDIRISRNAYGLDNYQFADQSSSIFNRCKVAYSRYYSCMKKTMAKTGISSSGDLAGVDWEAYSANASPILPERSQATKYTVHGLVIFLIVLVWSFL